jgi:hypothetical protein
MTLSYERRLQYFKENTQYLKALSVLPYLFSFSLEDRDPDLDSQSGSESKTPGTGIDIKYVCSK